MKGRRGIKEGYPRNRRRYSVGFIRFFPLTTVDMALTLVQLFNIGMDTTVSKFNPDMVINNNLVAILAGVLVLVERICPRACAVLIHGEFWTLIMTVN